MHFPYFIRYISHISNVSLRLVFGEEESHIRLHLTKNDVGHRIDMHLRKNKNKGVAVDGQSIKKSGELFGIIHMIFF